MDVVNYFASKFSVAVGYLYTRISVIFLNMYFWRSKQIWPFQAHCCKLSAEDLATRFFPLAASPVAGKILPNSSSFVIRNFLLFKFAIHGFSLKSFWSLFCEAVGIKCAQRIDAIARWIHPRVSYNSPGFESEAPHLHFSHL